MIQFIIDYRWNLLILAEIFFWISLFIATTLRYWFEKPKAALLVFILTLVNELWILYLGVLDLRQTGKLSIFQIIVVIIILYTLVLGKYDLKKVDRFIYRTIARIRGKPITDSQEMKLYGMAKAKEELKVFSLHVILFLGVHAVFYLMLYAVNQDAHPISSGELIPWLQEQFQNNYALVLVNKIWSAFLLLDGIISFSYLLFPKNESNKHVNR